MIHEPPEPEVADAPPARRRDIPAREAAPPVPPAPETPELGEPRRRHWLLIASVIVIAAFLFFRFFHHGGGKPQAQGGQGGAAGGRGPQGPVPVLATAATTKDVGVYLNGLGTVAPLNTVNVRSRVDGQLLRIDFTEGQIVRGGQLLAELDPRPFQVQLMQAEGQKSKDEATLHNAQVDLERYRVLY